MFVKILKLNYFASEKNSPGNPMALARDAEKLIVTHPLNFHSILIQSFSSTSNSPRRKFS